MARATRFAKNLIRRQNRARKAHIKADAIWEKAFQTGEAKDFRKAVDVTNIARSIQHLSPITVEVRPSNINIQSVEDHDLAESVADIMWLAT